MLQYEQRYWNEGKQYVAGIVMKQGGLFDSQTGLSVRCLKD